MKRIFSSVLILVMTLGVFSNFGMFAFAANQAGTVNCNALNVRSGAGSSYSKVAMLYKGAAVTVTGSANDSSGNKWYKISFTYSGTSMTGYAYASYITISNTSTDSSFEKYLTAQGFPDSYKPMLRTLHAKYPNWIFKAQDLNIDWNAALANEMVMGRNLVHSGAPDSWKSMEKGAYNFNGGYWYGMDGSWVAASKEIVAYYLDPRNFINDPSVFMFENLSYNSSIHTISGVKSILSGSFMSGNYTTPDTNKTYSYAQTFMDAAAKSGVSPYHLASRCLNEQGVNGAPQSLGTVANYKNYFNFFDIGAYATSTMSAAEMGCKYAATTNATYMLPWTNQYKSIVGGSIFLGNGYINKEQDTLYLQKFDVVDGGNGYYYHQYMTCVFGQENEAASMKKAYSASVLNSALEFKIPIYKNMPAQLCAKPTSSGDNNNCLSSLSVSRCSLDKAFDKYTMSYQVTDPVTASSVTVNAPALSSLAKVSGAGKVALKVGTNTINVNVTAPSGSVRTYTITVVRKADASYIADVTNLKAAAYTDLVKLTWSSVSGAEGYLLYQYDSSKKTWVRLVKTVNADNYTVSNLNSGTEYKFAIRAYKTVSGKEVLSESYPTVSATTKLPTVVGFKAASTAKYVKLSWNKVSIADGYVVYQYDAAKKTWVRLTKTTSNVDSYTVANLNAASEYKFAIRAYRTVSGNEILSESYPTLVSAIKPANVSNFKASYMANTVKLTWNKVSGANGYVVYQYNTAKKTWVRIMKTAGNVGSYTAERLNAATEYKFAIRAYKTVSGKELLSESYPTISAVTKLTTVDGFKAASTANSIKLNWNKVDGAEGYVVYRYDTTKKTWVRMIKTVGNADNYTAADLNSVTEYKFAIRAYKTIGGKEILSESYPTVSAVTKLTTVDGFKAASTANSVKLNWNKVSGAEGYVVYRYDTAKKTWVRMVKTVGNADNYTAAALNSATEYKFAIRAYKTIGGKEILSESFPQVLIKTE